MPTILDLAGIEHQGLMQGQSLLPAMTGQEDQDERAVFSDVSIITNRHYKSIRTLDHKLIYSPAQDSVSLFDLAGDPQEQYDISQTDKATTTRLQQLLSKMMGENEVVHQSLRGDVKQEPLKIDPETQRRLRALGYIQ